MSLASQWPADSHVSVDTEPVRLVDLVVSATWPESVRRLASTFLRDPIRITVGSPDLATNKSISQSVEVFNTSYEKDSRLLHHLASHMKSHPSSKSSPTRILVFALYKKEAQRIEVTIGRAGYKVAGLHGDLSQDKRFDALNRFKTGSVNVMVATDVAARGLDIPDVSLVINVTFPLTTGDLNPLGHLPQLMRQRTTCIDVVGQAEQARPARQ